MREVACTIHALVKIIPSLHDSFMKIFNITDLCFVHHFLHASPYLIIDEIQIWACMMQPFLELCVLEHHLAGKGKIQRILEFRVEGHS